MLADIGSAGNYNEVIDAGETIKLKVTLANNGQRDYLSTSGFLETEDQYVVVENEEAVYDEIYPGQAVQPKEVFTMTIHPQCPNGHVIWFDMLIWDTEYGRKHQRFGLKVTKVGPLEYASAVIDDDIPGPSDPVVEDGKLQEGEQIEFKLQLRNKGDVDIQDVTAVLSCDQQFIEITESEHKYPVIKAWGEQGTRADYDFSVGKPSEEALSNGYILLSVMTAGTANGTAYSWISPFIVPLEMTDKQRAELLKRAETVRRLVERANGEWQEIDRTDWEIYKTAGIASDGRTRYYQSRVEKCKAILSFLNQALELDPDQGLAAKLRAEVQGQLSQDREHLSKNAYAITAVLDWSGLDRAGSGNYSVWINAGEAHKADLVDWVNASEAEGVSHWEISRQRDNSPQRETRWFEAAPGRMVVTAWVYNGRAWAPLGKGLFQFRVDRGDRSHIEVRCGYDGRYVTAVVKQLE